MNRYPLAAFAGILSALIFASIPFGGLIGMLAICFSAAPMAAIGFAFGVSTFLLSSVVAVVLFLLSGYNVLGQIFLIVDFLPVLLVVFLFLYKRRLSGKEKYLHYGTVLSVLCVFASVLMIVGAKLVIAQKTSEVLSSGADINSQVISIKGMCADFLQKVITLSVPGQYEIHERFLSLTVPFAPSLAIISWLAHVAIGVCTGLWLAAKFKRVLRTVPNYKNLVLPLWLIVILFVAIGFAAVTDGDTQYLIVNSAMVLSVPLIFQGLAAVHEFAEKKTKYPKTFTTIFYAIFMVGSFWAIAAVAILGLVEHFIKSRHKIIGAALEE